MTKINRELNRFETRLNVLGSIPLIGVGSGFVRICFGNVQFVAGCGIGSLGLIGQLIHGDSKSMDNLTKVGSEHMMHGALNSIRGVGEMFTAESRIGPIPLSIIPLSIQLLSKEGFAPRFKYEETESFTA